MKIFIKGEDEKEWRVTEPGVFASEKDLQVMIAETPEPFLGPLGEINKPGEDTVFLTKMEAGVSVGSVDVLGVDKEGDIYIIECKLYRNPEVRREVVGQILEYAASLYRMDYDDFCGKIVSGSSLELIGIMESMCIEKGLEFDAEEFESGVNANLETGEFNLAIVVDAIRDDLRTTISYLNELTRFVIVGLQVSHVKNEGLKIEAVIPTVYGEKLKAPHRASSRDFTKEMRDIGKVLFDESLMEDVGHPTKRMYYGCLLLHPGAALVAWVNTDDKHLTVSFSPEKELVEIVGPEYAPSPVEFGIEFTRDVEIKQSELKHREWWIRKHFEFEAPGVYINEVVLFIRELKAFLEKVLAAKEPA